MRFDKKSLEGIAYRVDIIRNGVAFGQLACKEAPTITMEESAELKTWMTGVFAPNKAFDPLNDLLRPILLIEGA